MRADKIERLSLIAVVWSSMTELLPSSLQHLYTIISASSHLLCLTDAERETSVLDVTADSLSFVWSIAITTTDVADTCSGLPSRICERIQMKMGWLKGWGTLTEKYSKTKYYGGEAIHWNNRSHSDCGLMIPFLSSLQPSLDYSKKLLRSSLQFLLSLSCFTLCWLSKYLFLFICFLFVVEIFLYPQWDTDLLLSFPILSFPSIFYKFYRSNQHINSWAVQLTIPTLFLKIRNHIISYYIMWCDGF